MNGHKATLSGLALAACVLATGAMAQGVSCNRFTASTAKGSGGQVNLPWRTDLPTTMGSDPAPWTTIDFKTQWQAYLAAVLSTVKSSGLTIQNNQASMAANARWWIAPWMDYGAAGREPIHGLTKERRPQDGDLTPTFQSGGQVWAVGFYNARGARRLRTVFQDPCDPKYTKGQVFPERTASFKLLFTDLDGSDVPYLSGSPTINAMINPASGGTNRVVRQVRLLQMDIAVRDARATDTGWVFGTYVWKGPATGDGLFDNLVPVGLMWGNDPGVVTTNVVQSQVNPQLGNILYGWPSRPWMGYRGRVNGPADNRLSACTSCHGASQWPKPRSGFVVSGIVGTSPTDIQTHINKYFRNIKGGTLFDNTIAGAIPLDYSLQLYETFNRMCDACSKGALTGKTPKLCKVANSHLGTNCPAPSLTAAPLPVREEPLSRQ